MQAAPQEPFFRHSQPLPPQSHLNVTRVCTGLEISASAQWEDCRSSETRRLMETIMGQQELILKLSGVLNKRQPGSVVTITQKVPVPVPGEVRQVVKEVPVIKQVIKYVPVGLDSRFAMAKGSLSAQRPAEQAFIQAPKKDEARSEGEIEALREQVRRLRDRAEEAEWLANDRQEVLRLRVQLHEAKQQLYHLRALAGKELLDLDPEPLARDSEIHQLRDRLIRSQAVNAQQDLSLRALRRKLRQLRSDDSLLSGSSEEEPAISPTGGEAFETVTGLGQQLQAQIFCLREENERLARQNEQLREAFLGLDSQLLKGEVFKRVMEGGDGLARYFSLVQEYFKKKGSRVPSQQQIQKVWAEAEDRDWTLDDTQFVNCLVGGTEASLLAALREKTEMCKRLQKDLRSVQSSIQRLPIRVRQELLSQSKQSLLLQIKEVRQLATGLNQISEQKGSLGTRDEEEWRWQEEMEGSQRFTRVLTEQNSTHLKGLEERILDMQRQCQQARSGKGPKPASFPIREEGVGFERGYLQSRIQNLLQAIERREPGLGQRFLIEVFERVREEYPQPSSERLQSGVEIQVDERLYPKISSEEKRQHLSQIRRLSSPQQRERLSEIARSVQPQPAEAPLS